MDNLSSHKVKGVIEPITEAGSTVVYLPPYSPDLNPKELVWSKVKAYLRKTKARSSGRLFYAISDALDSISLSDIKNRFAHDNYSHVKCNCYNTALAAFQHSSMNFCSCKPTLSNSVN